MGHPLLRLLYHLGLPFDVNYRLECESCQLGKHHRVSYPSQLNKVSLCLFQLVHLDVWGPCRVPNRQGFKYFVTFVDNYSCATWLYLLKEHPKVLYVFESFFTKIKTQFNIVIAILRYDNALEYNHSTLSEFCRKQGIIHQTSCSYSPQ